MLSTSILIQVNQNRTLTLPKTFCSLALRPERHWQCERPSGSLRAAAPL